MQQYIIKRILLMIPVIFGVTLLLFTLIRIVPGDVVDVMYGEYTTFVIRPLRVDGSRLKVPAIPFVPRSRSA